MESLADHPRRGGVQVDVVDGKPLNFDASEFTSGHCGVIASYHKSCVVFVKWHGESQRMSAVVSLSLPES